MPNFQDGKLHELAAKSYLKALAENKSALLVAPTWNEIETMTEKVRAELKSSGRLALEEKGIFLVFDSLSWTEAQKRDARQYRPGMAIHFHRRGSMVLKKGKRLRWSPSKMTRSKINMLTAPKALFPILKGAFACFDVGEKRKLKVAAG